MAVASLILGIISIVMSFIFPGYQWVGVICGIIGIIFGVKGRKQPERQGLATAGLVCSIIGTVLCILFYVACTACVGGIASLAS